MLISPGGEPGLSITPRKTMKVRAASAVTAVSSPRGHERACPRTMIQVRIAGAAAASSRRKRRIDRACHPVHEVWGPWQELSTACWLPSAYQERKIEIPSTAPPTVASSSPLSSLVKSIGAEPNRFKVNGVGHELALHAIGAVEHRRGLGH